MQFMMMGPPMMAMGTFKCLDDIFKPLDLVANGMILFCEQVDSLP